MTSEQRLAVLESHVRELSEQYDAVQILGTWLDTDGKTRSQKRGSGNWYARQHMAREFVQESMNEDLAGSIANKLEPPEEDWKGAG